MYDGFFALGGQEIANSPRALGLQRSSNCSVDWLDDRDNCETLSESLLQDDYTIGNITQAPWYDPDIHDRSSRILGLSIIDMAGIQDDTRQAPMREKVTEGASIGRTRWAGRQVRITAILTAIGQDALDAGMTWLRTALSARICGVHGTSCGLTDFEFFTDCPPAREIAEAEFDYVARVNKFRRYLHSVKTISGPYIVRPLVSRKSAGVVGNMVEFTIGAEVPHIFTIPVEIAAQPTIPVVTNDIPFNLVPRPQPYNQLTPKVVAAKQLVVNPSAETNATGWTASVAAVSGSAPSGYFTSGRISGEISSIGTASYRARILGNSSTTASGRALITVQQDTSLDSALERVSVGVSAAAFSAGGSAGAALVSVTAKIEWRTASSSISVTTIATSTDPSVLDGQSHALVGQLPPATATIARLIVEFVVDWSSSSTPASNSDIRTYVDAMSVTVP